MNTTGKCEHKHVDHLDSDNMLLDLEKGAVCYNYAADINTVKTQASEASGRGWASLDCKVWDGVPYKLREVI